MPPPSAPPRPQTARPVSARPDPAAIVAGPQPPLPPLARPSGAGARRLAALAILAVMSVYTVRLARQFAVAQRAESDRAVLAARTGALETETTALQTETAFAGSDAYVERWAREDKHWVRPGDQPVQVVQATAGAPAAATPEAPGLIERFWGWLSR